MAQHTPGPWHTRPIPDTGQIAIAQPTRMFPFASVGPWYDPKEGKPELTDTDYANAALIAAAPDLLADLRQLAHLAETLNGRQHAGLEITPAMWSLLHDVTNQVKATITKAEAVS